VALGEALQPEFKEYGRVVAQSARSLADTLSSRGVRIVSNGTDTHLVLVDVSSMGLRGLQAQDLLSLANLTSNSNPTPSDSSKPSEWTGIRLGSGAGVTRGFGAAEFVQIGHMIADMLEAGRAGTAEPVSVRVKASVLELCRKHPLYR
jgi:glycine hydroxymethyltransferase